MSKDTSNLLPSSFKLNNGRTIPTVGLGCWMGYPGGGEDVEKMVKLALKNGYRHFDTASGYGNEEHVGKAIRESGIPRGKIFLTTKLGNGDHGRVLEAFEESLKLLDCGYVDLYLMHWPQAINSAGNVLQPDEDPNFIQTWHAMEKLLETGLVKTIGVSNFSIKTLNVLLPEVNVIPAVNQVQLHPCLPDQPLVEYCGKKNILLTAWSPLGQANAPFYSDETCLEIAKKNNLTVGQVILSWGVQRGTVVIPKSTKEERLQQNLAITKLAEEDVTAIDNLHKKPGMHRQLFTSDTIPGGTGEVFGWTYEQLGWNLRKDGSWIE